MTFARGELSIVDSGPLRQCILSRPQRRNALSEAVCDALRTAIGDCPPAIGLVSISGEGETFCSGADLRETASYLLRDKPQDAPTLQAIRRLFESIEQSPIPVAALIDGKCLAGGLELVLACDLVVASRRSMFFDAHIENGLLPSGGAAIRLRERIGTGRAFRLIAEGLRIDAEQALAWGLVDAVLDDPSALSAWASQTAARFSSLAPGLVRSIKRQLSSGRAPRTGPLFALELAELEAYLAAHRQETADRLHRFLPTVGEEPGGR